MIGMAASLCLPWTAEAAPATISQQILDQQRRIDDGITAGMLTHSEAAVVQDNLNLIKLRYSRFRSDGVLTRSERSSIQSLLDQNSLLIYKKKRDFVRFFDSEFEKRIGDQQRRIDRGRARGTLTRAEVVMLQENLNHIRRRYAALNADGRLMRRERDELDALLDRNSRMIYDRKHNPIVQIY